MKTVNHLVDPFRFCEDNCTHDLTAGVSVRDLLARDGPHPAKLTIVGLAGLRAVLLDGNEVPDAA